MKVYLRDEANILGFILIILFLSLIILVKYVVILTIVYLPSPFFFKVNLSFLNTDKQNGTQCFTEV